MKFALAWESKPLIMRRAISHEFIDRWCWRNVSWIKRTRIGCIYIRDVTVLHEIKSYQSCRSENTNWSFLSSENESVLFTCAEITIMMRCYAVAKVFWVVSCMLPRLYYCLVFQYKFLNILKSRCIYFWGKMTKY